MACWTCYWVLGTYPLTPQLWTENGKCAQSDTTMYPSRLRKPWPTGTGCTALHGSETGLKSKDREFGCNKKGNTNHRILGNDITTCPLCDLQMKSSPSATTASWYPSCDSRAMRPCLPGRCTGSGVDLEELLTWCQHLIVPWILPPIPGWLHHPHEPKIKPGSKVARLGLLSESMTDSAKAKTQGPHQN